MKVLPRFKDRFCDVSLFVKELKERFSHWFYKQNGRRGTLWMDRFKSVLVDGGAALATMAGYLDLNCLHSTSAKISLARQRSIGTASPGSTCKRTRA